MVTPGAFVVGSRMEDLDPDDRCARWLDQRVQPSQRWAARGVRVWHWRRPKPAPPRVIGPPAPARARVSPSRTRPAPVQKPAPGVSHGT
jgi:hypothetical protein